MTLDEYMKLPYRMEIVPDAEEGGYVVAFPDLPGCITCGNTLESAISNASDAKKAWIEAALEEGIVIARPDELDNYSCQLRLQIPKSLHWLLSEHSQKEGTNINQYCLYLLSRNDAIHSQG